MYEALLFAHSWVRWIIALAGIYFFLHCVLGAVTRKIPEAKDEHFIWAFNQVLNGQFALGLGIWISSSPYVKQAFHSWDTVSSNPIVSFWTLRHPLTMIAAIALVNIGGEVAKKFPREQAFTVYTVTYFLFLVLVASAIPWPSLIYGRTLIRGF